MHNEKMRCFVGLGEGKGGFVSVDVPHPKSNEVLVKVSYCGVCGTDQDLFSGDCSFAKNGQVTYPVRLGHEWSGVICETGENVTRFAKGDRVISDNIVCCGECPECQSGDYGHCSNIKYLGTINPIYDGAFAEYLVLPEYHVYKIPSTLSLKEAALCEPLSVAYGATSKMDITPNSTVAVIGTGCIGLAAVVLAKCAGAKQVFLIGRNKEKLRYAEMLGACVVNTRERDACSFIMEKTNGTGVDFVIECSGAAGTFLQAIEISRARAKIALIGFYENKENDVDIDKIVSKELCIIGIMGEYGNVGAVLKILGEYKPNLLPIITEELSFDECEPAFTRRNYPNAIKIMINIGDEIND